ncbi:MAG: dTDP-4-dehydrorhamnose reductase [Pseudomonadota bacterium]
MRLLITGANGQVGQALIENANQQNIEVFAYSKETLDISSETMVTVTLNRYQPDIVINAAAYTNVEQAESSPELAKAINEDAVGILARACDSLNIPLLHISTDYVFDGKKQTPYLETDETAPLSVYGETKLIGEKQLIALARKYIILRTSWVFSATGNNFVKTMLRLFRERTEVSVVNDQLGGPTSADAIAKALLKIAARALEPDFNNWGVYHFSGEPAVSWYEFACAIRDCCSQESLKLEKLLPITSDQFPTKAARPAYAVLDMKKIYTVFGIMPCDWQKDLITCLK